MKTIQILIMISGLFATQIAFADCYYNGTKVPVGTEIGGKVCQATGGWK